MLSTFGGEIFCIRCIYLLKNDEIEHPEILSKLDGASVPHCDVKIIFIIWRIFNCNTLN